MSAERAETGPERPQVYPYARPETYEFLQAAIAEGAHLEFPANPNKASNWVRERNIAGVYFGSPATLQEIGDIYVVSRERIRQVINVFLKQLHSRCSEEVQERFPLEKIVHPVSKPISEEVRDRQSRVQGGKRLEIRSLVASGVVNPDEIASKLGMRQGRVRTALKSLRKRGLAPDSNLNRWPYILDGIEKAVTDEEIAGLLGRINSSTIARHPECFITIGDVANIAGFRFRRDKLKEFIGELNEAGIPFASIEFWFKDGKSGRSYYILRKQVERVRAVLESSEKLKEFRSLSSARQVGGPEVEFPNTTDLVKERGFKKVLISKFGLEGKDLIGSPVPVFRMSRYFVRGEDLDAFMAFVAEVKKS